MTRKQTITATNRRRVEAAFHRLDPRAFDALMAKAVHVDPSLPTSIRLPSALVGIVTVLARLEGKPYQTLMKEWIREAALARARVLSLALQTGQAKQATQLQAALEALRRKVGGAGSEPRRSSGARKTA